MIEERATATLYILYKPFSILVPKLAVASAYDLRLEADRCGRRDICWNGWLAVSFGIATDTNDLGSAR